MRDMKEFVVTIDRIVKQVRTITIKAESEEQAYEAATDIAVENEGWDGKEYEVKYEINLEEVPNFYIDRYGNPYDCEDPDACWPAGGGLHKDCEFNADVLYAYYTIGDRYKIADYLHSKGFKETLHGADEEVWVKGNTEVTYECYDNGGHLWGYMHTEKV
jgi:hypothetical protein